MTLNPLAYMLDANVVREEAYYDMGVTDAQMEALRERVTDETIQSYIEKVNPDFEWEDNTRGKFFDLMTDQVTMGAQKVLAVLVKDEGL